MIALHGHRFSTPPCLLGLTWLLAGCSPSAPSLGPAPVAGGWKNQVHRDTLRALVVMVRTPKDSSEREWYRMYQGEQRQKVEGNEVIVAVQGAAAFQWADTLTMAAAGLAPLHESLHLANRRIQLTYAGTRVTRIDQSADSAASTSTVDFAEPVYAFNQLDILLRSVPLEAGRTVILPLYSEVTAELEHDTLQVLRGPSPGMPGYTLRFADPAIISTVIIDPGTREFLSYETRWRTRPGVMRRIPATPAGPPS